MIPGAGRVVSLYSAFGAEFIHDFPLPSGLLQERRFAKQGQMVVIRR
jgi:hypothetical protein